MTSALGNNFAPQSTQQRGNMAQQQQQQVYGQPAPMLQPGQYRGGPVANPYGGMQQQQQSMDWAHQITQAFNQPRIFGGARGPGISKDSGGGTVAPAPAAPVQAAPAQAAPAQPIGQELPSFWGPGSSDGGG